MGRTAKHVVYVVVVGEMESLQPRTGRECCLLGMSQIDRNMMGYIVPERKHASVAALLQSLCNTACDFRHSLLQLHKFHTVRQPTTPVISALKSQ